MAFNTPQYNKKDKNILPKQLEKDYFRHYLESQMNGSIPLTEQELDYFYNTLLSDLKENLKRINEKIDNRKQLITAYDEKKDEKVTKYDLYVTPPEFWNMFHHTTNAEKQISIGYTIHMHRNGYLMDENDNPDKFDSHECIDYHKVFKFSHNLKEVYRISEYMTANIYDKMYNVPNREKYMIDEHSFIKLPDSSLRKIVKELYKELPERHHLNYLLSNGRGQYKSLLFFDKEIQDMYLSLGKLVFQNRKSELAFKSEEDEELLGFLKNDEKDEEIETTYKDLSIGMLQIKDDNTYTINLSYKSDYKETQEALRLNIKKQDDKYYPYFTLIKQDDNTNLGIIDKNNIDKIHNEKLKYIVTQFYNEFEKYLDFEKTNINNATVEENRKLEGFDRKCSQALIELLKSTGYTIKRSEAAPIINIYKELYEKHFIKTPGINLSIPKYNKYTHTFDIGMWEGTREILTYQIDYNDKDNKNLSLDNAHIKLAYCNVEELHPFKARYRIPKVDFYNIGQIESKTLQNVAKEFLQKELTKNIGEDEKDTPDITDNL